MTIPVNPNGTPAYDPKRSTPDPLPDIKLSTAAKTLIAIACFVVSGFGIYMSMVPAWDQFTRGSSPGFGLVSHLIELWLWTPLFCWLALVVMTIGWIRERKVSGNLYIPATIISIPWLLIFNLWCITILPCIVLAFVVLGYHRKLADQAKT